MKDHRGDKILSFGYLRKSKQTDRSWLVLIKVLLSFHCFLMVNFFLFMILHRVLVIVMGLPMFVLILVQLVIFVFFGILIFRYVIFDEEAKMREYSDKNSDPLHVSCT